MTKPQDARAAARAFASVVVLDGERWYVCPYDGAECCRYPAEGVGEQWASDVMDRHIDLHHKPWR